MKSIEKIAGNVFRRRDEYLKEKRTRVIKTIFVLPCASLLACVCHVAFTETNAAITEDIDPDQYVEAFVAEASEELIHIVGTDTFVPAVSEKPVIRDKKILYNEEGGTAAFLYELSPEGYLVLEPNECKVIEYSFSNAYPYVENGMNYYNGPLQYYTKNGDEFQHSSSGSIIDAEDYREMRLNFESRTKGEEDRLDEIIRKPE